MPWIRSIRVFGPLWIAWSENDLHEMNDKKLGWSQASAESRVAWAVG